MDFRYPMFRELPEPGPVVGPTITRLIEELREYHQALVSEGAQLSLASTPATIASALGQASLSTRIIAVIARRLDPDVSDRLHELADGLESVRRRTEFMESAEEQQLTVDIERLVEGAPSARSMITSALAINEGLMIATMIDGPARGAATLHVTAHAEARAEATARAEALSTVSQIIDSVEKNDDIPNALLPDLRDLEVAIEEGEDGPSLLSRLANITDKAKPWADLTTALMSLAAKLFS